MVKKYIPEKGDIVWVDFNPTLGHEQKGLRPALVISPSFFNIAYGMFYVCPITSSNRNFNTHIKFEDANVSGYAMTEQLRSMDWRKRKIKFIKKSNADFFEEVMNCIKATLLSM